MTAQRPRSTLLRTAALAAPLILASLGLAAPPAAAQQASPPAEAPSPLRIELNRLEPQGNGCRVWLVLNNPGAEAVDPLRLDLVLFGQDGVIARRVAVDAGPLPADKTSVRIFDLSGLPCENVGALLLNDLLACGGTDAAARGACLSRLSVSSRADGVAFDK